MNHTSRAEAMTQSVD